MISEKWYAALRAKQEEDLARNDQNLNQEVGQFDNLVMAANQQRAVTAHQRDVAMLSLFKNAARSPNGASDPALNQACGAAFGIPGFSGIRMINNGSEAGSFEVTRAVKNQNGQIVPDTVMLISPEIMAGCARRLRNQGYNTQDVAAMSNYAWMAGKKRYGLTDQQLSERGFQNPNGPILVGGTTSTQNIRNSRNGMIGTNLMDGSGLVNSQDSGARPGPRARFVSEDDLNGTPYKDENAPGRRYLGHGIHSFSTADWQEDREEKRRREQQGYDVAMEQAKAKQRNGSSGRSVEDQMAIDDNRAKNAKQAQEGKKDLALKKLYEKRVADDERAIDEYAKNRKKGKKVGNVEAKLTDEEMARAEKDIAAYRKRREEARAKDFEGFDFGKKNESGDGASGEGSSTTHSAGGAGTTSVQQQGGGASVAGGGQAAGKKEDNVSTASGSGDRPTDEEWKKMSTAEKRAWLKAHKE